MELPHLGQNCNICNRNDYLPFKCTSCSKIVCIDHRSNHGSDCPMNESTFELDSSRFTGESLKKMCDFCRKITLKLELTKCDHCPGNHCLYHRHQVQHNCPKLAEEAQIRERQEELRVARRNEALERLKETQRESAVVRESHKPPVIQAQAPHAPSVDPKKLALARRVRIMKLKQSARGPPNISDSDKIYFEVKFFHEPKSSLSIERKHDEIVNIFATSNHTVGRLVDWSADQLGLNNKNHHQSSDQLIFRKQTIDGKSYIDLDSLVTFEKYLDSSVLQSGDELQLTYLVISP